MVAKSYIEHKKVFFNLKTMKEKYLKIKNLSVSENLANFINNELLAGIKINKKWQ